jgi:hypothetical protein
MQMIHTHKHKPEWMDGILAMPDSVDPLKKDANFVNHMNRASKERFHKFKQGRKNVMFYNSTLQKVIPLKG